MFICDKCIKHNGLNTSVRKSHGRCEICGEYFTCNDIPSKNIPLEACPLIPYHQEKENTIPELKHTCNILLCPTTLILEIKTPLCHWLHCPTCGKKYKFYYSKLHDLWLGPTPIKNQQFTLDELMVQQKQNLALLEKQINGLKKTE